MTRAQLATFAWLMTIGIATPACRSGGHGAAAPPEPRAEVATHTEVAPRAPAATRARAARAPAIPPELRFRSHLSDQHEALLAYERELQREPASYARRSARAPAERFRADGLYHEPHSGAVWAFSRSHREQRGFAYRRGRWRPVGTRAGPLDTRRCVALEGERLTLCVGLLAKRGVRAFGPAPFASALPDRSGFLDLAVDEAHDRLYVIDAYVDVLWLLDLAGAVHGRVSLAPGAYRVGRLGSNHLFVLSSNQPHLSILPLEESGMPETPVGIETTATIREAVFDPERDLLWTAGYRQTRVRRRRGYIEGLESFLYAYRAADLTRGAFTPVVAIDLARHGLADPVALSVEGDHLVVALAGSHRLVRVDLERVSEHGPEEVLDAAGGGLSITHARTALVPRAVLAVKQHVLSAGYLDDRLQVHEQADLAPRRTISLAAAGGERAPPSPYDLGELLFYSKSMWADTPRNQFTCNSCHWDGLTDYRVHPGYRESRWEQIRPAAGAGVLAPVFTPGQAANLTTAIHGFVRALDDRFWTNPDQPVWLDDLAVDIGRGEPLVLTPYEVRRALLTYLARRPIEPGLLRAPGEPLSDSARRGAAIFWRDCARCHEPTARMGQGPPLTLAGGLAYLVERPLALGAARRLRTGVEPYFTRRGNRVSPLTQLSRGGPYFSNGSAPTLHEVIRRTDPTRPEAHAPENAARPHYDTRAARHLIDFLLSI